MQALLEKKRIYQVEPGPESPAAFDKYVENLRPLYGRLFKNEAEYELFCMLPLSNEQRLTVLQAMIEERKFHEDVKSCRGAADTCSDHRKFCMHCVLKHRPSIAEPLY